MSNAQSCTCIKILGTRTLEPRLDWLAAWHITAGRLARFSNSRYLDCNAHMFGFIFSTIRRF
jgi:hypothetical protein